MASHEARCVQVPVALPHADADNSPTVSAMVEVHRAHAGPGNASAQPSGAPTPTASRPQRADCTTTGRLAHPRGAARAPPARQPHGDRVAAVADAKPAGHGTGIAPKMCVSKDVHFTATNMYNFMRGILLPTPGSCPRDEVHSSFGWPLLSSYGERCRKPSRSRFGRLRTSRPVRWFSVRSHFMSLQLIPSTGVRSGPPSCWALEYPKPASTVK